MTRPRTTNRTTTRSGPGPKRSGRADTRPGRGDARPGRADARADTREAPADARYGQKRPSRGDARRGPADTRPEAGPKRSGPKPAERSGPKPADRSGPGPKRRARMKGDLRHVRAAEPKSDADKAAAQEARSLSGRATRYLRGLGHHLEPIVQIGKDGITEGVVTATRAALLAHELVKVRVSTESPIDRKDAGAELAEHAGAALAQTLGRTLLLYKRHPHKPKIELPR